MYIVVQRFTDLEHKHKYEAGDKYPAEGLTASSERIEALKSGNNKAGLKLIKEVKGGAEPKTEPKAEKPKTAKPKAKSKAKSGGKKASK
jgi:hypothetical protein